MIVSFLISIEGALSAHFQFFLASQMSRDLCCCMSNPPPCTLSLLNPTDAQEKERAGEGAPVAIPLLLKSASPFVVQQAGIQGQGGAVLFKARFALCAL